MIHGESIRKMQLLLVFGCCVWVLNRLLSNLLVQAELTF